MNAMVSNTIGRTAIAPIGRAGQSDSPLLYLHCGICIQGNTWLSDETFRLLSFEGEENVSQPFEYQLQLRGNTAPQDGRPLSFEAVIGRPVTVGINDPTKVSQPDAAARFMQALRTGSAPDITLYNGIVSSFAMDEPGVYRLGMKPALWKLTLTNRYYVHAQMSVRDVIAAVMREHYIHYSLEAVSGNDNLAVTRVQDWLQAGESDYEFLQRLMSKAHIYYYVTHTGNRHTVVFANRPAYPQAFGHRPLRYTHTTLEELGRHQNDVVFQYSYQQSMTSSGINTSFVYQESAWNMDPVPSFQTYAATTPADTGELPFNLYRTYQYGIDSAETRDYMKRTASSLASSARQLSGSSTCTGFRVGHQFTLSGDMAAGVQPSPVRPTLEGKPFVLSKVTHKASADGGYTNEFEATDASGMLTAFSVSDTQQGVILARVVDTQGQRPADWRYYEPSNFDPESSVYSDSTANPRELHAQGVYVQFSTPGGGSKPVWVKLGAGMQTVPEIGVTVLVARAQDESELPEIQQIVQANGTMTVTPSGWTATTHVGSSYSTNYADTKNIRFGRNTPYDLDTAIATISDAYDTGQFIECGYTLGGSYSYTSAVEGYGGMLSTTETIGRTYSTHQGEISWNKSTLTQSTSYSSIVDSFSEETVSGTATSISTRNIVNSTATDNVVTSVTTQGIVTNTTTQGTVSNTTTVDTETNVVKQGTVTNTTTQGTVNNTTTVGTETNVVEQGTVTSTTTQGTVTNVTTQGTVANTTTVGTETNVVHQGTVTTTTTADTVTNTTTQGTVNNTTTVTTETNTTHQGTVTSTTTQGTVNNTSTVDSETNDITQGTVSTTTHATSVTNNTTQGKVDNTTDIGSETSTTTYDSNKQTTTTGTSNVVSITGAMAQTNIVGASVDTNITGAMQRTNITGVGSTVSVTGASSEISITGADVRINVIGAGLSVTRRSVGGDIDLSPERGKMSIEQLVVKIPMLRIFL
ncbi:contractile injection system protein, VgrG/Pvc8 family [Dyella subtropica]|uniref:contractile injection system protein, VgrG/Pvc8 family n=1 Tax=Dyella subtropica TaxID=2992127 RepID=UPI002254C321|nr:contractile injection system protein, VgrG/Pvc8 family [Dyella subtropica]